MSPNFKSVRFPKLNIYKYIENIFVDVHSFMSRTAITLKFKMSLFLDEASY